MPRRLNIAFFGSNLLSADQNSPAAFYRGLVRALSEKGHRITFYEPEIEDAPAPKYQGARIITFGPEDESALEALEHAEESDLIVKCSGVGICDDLLEAAVLELKRPETLVAFLDADAPATLDRIQPVMDEIRSAVMARLSDTQLVEATRLLDLVLEGVVEVPGLAHQPA